MYFFPKLTNILGGGRSISRQYKYQAFISYAHKDEAIAGRLHRALETYRIPKNTASGTQKNLSPIFRDAAELSAHHSLSEKIQEAVQSSRFLIVLCSPAAKQSHWVNEEIRLFRSLQGEGSILCVLVEGTPETSFPSALLEGGREPLAANLGDNKESFKLGTTQLAASILGVGLDVLIQREAKRRRRRLQLITASALVFSGVMGAMTLTAIDARNDAQDSRAQAEDLVEYMITDLKDKLEPVGRLDILDSVGDRAVDYYETQNVKKLPDKSLLRQARARLILGQVAFDAIRKDDAIREIEAAAELTSQVLKRNPENAEAIFAHAQSEFWRGQIDYGQGNLEGLINHWVNYDKLSQRLYEKDPYKTEWVIEAGYAKNNLGMISMLQKQYNEAFVQFNNAIKLYNGVLNVNSQHRLALTALANSYAGAATAALKLKQPTDALKYRKLQIDIYDNILREEQNNYAFIQKRASAKTNILKHKLIPQNSPVHSKFVKEISEAYVLITEHDPDNTVWKRQYERFSKNFVTAEPVVVSGP